MQCEVVETYIWKPHKGTFECRNQRLPLFPAHDAIQATLPTLQVLTLLLQRLFHLREPLLPTHPLLHRELAQDVQHAHLEIRLPQLKRAWELHEGGFVEVGEALEGYA